MFTRFMDMHSGGGQKEHFSHCYIEAPLDEAKVIFYNRFGHSPERVTCTCCGEDYSIDDYETLEHATAYERGCRSVKIDGAWKYIEEGDPERTWQPYQSLADYVKRANVCVIRADQISDDEREGELPLEGYVWM